jgi:hypothetical protein
LNDFSSHDTGCNGFTGSFLDQKSVMFQEEFPQLAVGSEEKNVIPRKEDENKEASHGLGLNLRPQSELLRILCLQFKSRGYLTSDFINYRHHRLSATLPVVTSSMLIDSC